MTENARVQKAGEKTAWQNTDDTYTQKHLKWKLNETNFQLRKVTGERRRKNLNIEIEINEIWSRKVIKLINKSKCWFGGRLTT